MIIIKEGMDNLTKIADFYDKWVRRKMGGNYAGLCDIASIVFAELAFEFSRFVYIQQWDMDMETHTSCIVGNIVYDFTIYQYKSTIPIANNYRQPLKVYEKHFTRDLYGMNGDYKPNSKLRKDWLFTLGGERAVMKDKEEVLNLFHKNN